VCVVPGWLTGVGSAVGWFVRSFRVAPCVGEVVGEAVGDAVGEAVGAAVGL
jgi:hypothetical protein